jgi:hypothetical protein
VPGAATARIARRELGNGRWAPNGPESISRIVYPGGWIRDRTIASVDQRRHAPGGSRLARSFGIQYFRLPSPTPEPRTPSPTTRQPLPFLLPLVSSSRSSSVTQLLIDTSTCCFARNPVMTSADKYFVYVYTLNASVGRRFDFS